MLKAITGVLGLGRKREGDGGSTELRFRRREAARHLEARRFHEWSRTMIALMVHEREQTLINSGQGVDDRLHPYWGRRL